MDTNEEAGGRGSRRAASYLKRSVAVLAIYCVFGIGGVLVGSGFVDDPLGNGDFAGAICFAPLLNLVPIIAASVDPLFPVTLLCWFLFPVAALTYVMRGRWWTLGLVALASLTMNLHTLPRYWGMMSA